MTVDESVEPDRAVPAPSGWSGVRSLLLRLHFYAGILIAPFLVVAALSGLLFVFTPQLDELVYDDVVSVADSPASVPLAQQVDAGLTARPDDTLMAVRPATTGTDATQIIFAAPDLPESYRRTVFVNPHSAEVTGVLETYGSGQALPIQAWVDNLHRGLHLGDIGRLYSELAASWLWIVAIGGVVLWFSRRRKRTLLRPESGAKGRRRTLSWHGATGMWLAVGLVFLSATGLTWSQYAGGNITELRSALSWETPAVSGTVHSPTVSSSDVGLDRITAAARERGLSGDIEVTPPSGTGEAYIVQQVGRQWPTQQDSVAIDPANAQVTETLRFEDFPLIAKLARWGIDAHMGLLFGWVNQVVLVLLGGGLLCVIFWGYRMWWLRRPTRGMRRGFGRPPLRGMWRRVPGSVLAPLAVLALFVGYFVPLLGISLLLFLLLDCVLGLRARRAVGDRKEVAS
ncbi:putative iron-regulated membrane protein [Tamaricihabitans halophyticus]|uniref:Putative iron-regulated membrane protein n=1 Tax=Tamaricihabitans halophyticus TaxID=1262583 RepID=A0A4R2Q4E0_9PSEU|nr:PepSY-associated TM helix domain-containing protein [Tamaricihabitans halophyticus]TCP42628.1 putative iron-regulated membrane protein [Tamaricihabitans halophyticus]